MSAVESQANGCDGEHAHPRHAEDDPFPHAIRAVVRHARDVDAIELRDTHSEALVIEGCELCKANFAKEKKTKGQASTGAPGDKIAFNQMMGGTRARSLCLLVKSAIWAQAGAEIRICAAESGYR